MFRRLCCNSNVPLPNTAGLQIYDSFAATVRRHMADGTIATCTPHGAWRAVRSHRLITTSHALRELRSISEMEAKLSQIALCRRE